jgi:hypothetical protein
MQIFHKVALTAAVIGATVIAPAPLANARGGAAAVPTQAPRCRVTTVAPPPAAQAAQQPAHTTAANSNHLPEGG